MSEREKLLYEARDLQQWMDDMEHRGVSSLRKIKAETLRGMTRPTVIHHQAQPIAVLIPYERFMSWQDLCAALQAKVRPTPQGLARCEYKLNDGPCGAPIVSDHGSYTGFSHQHRMDHGQPVDWLHWATSVPYGRGEASMDRVFVPCAVCGKRGPDNEAHIRFDGHKFTTVRT